MEEIARITEKYQPDYIRDSLQDLDSLNAFATAFFKDVAELYDCFTRIKNVERNPSGFSIDDATILGLLVRVWKLMKEVIRYYETGNAEIISVLERPLLEGATVAAYLMSHGPDVLLDHRKCAFKDRLRIIRELESGSPFFDTKPGKRLLASVYEKLALEGFTKDDFAEQKKNKWRLQGKTFFDIFAEVHQADFYPSTYGMMSESIHGSWAESLDWCLFRNDDGTFTANPFSYPADIRFMVPTLQFTNKSYRMWLERIGVYDENMAGLFAWIEKVMRALYAKFDQLFDDEPRQGV